MKIKVQKTVRSSAGLLVAPIYKDDFKKIPSYFPKEVRDFIGSLVKSKDFSGKKGESIVTYFDKKGVSSKLMVIGLGELEQYRKRHTRRIGGAVGKQAKKMKAEEINILFPTQWGDDSQEFVEGVLMGQYDVGKLKTSGKKSKKKYELKALNVVVEKKPRDIENYLEKGKLISMASELVKDLVNMPANIVDGEYLAKEARRIAKENGYKIAVYKNKELKKMKWGGLLAVNQGSEKDAYCLVLEYDGAKSKKEKPIVIVGKGVIFDTGGYNLKPTSSIETMQQDMAGGATVLGVFDLLKKMKIKKNIIGIVPIAENLISEDAYRPSDIITMLSGKTVEITNTDAEGRLILADALTYGSKFNPECMITIATLTGAVAVALGNRYAGLLGNNTDLRRKLQRAGRSTDDRGWPLPIINDYRDKMKSKVADLRNYDLGTGRYGGTLKAAAFLEKFVGDNKWCHIDIGGTAFTDDPKEYQTSGATAHGLRMLVEFLEDKPKK